MAKVKFGMFMTDARGKVGGQVFSKNRAGAYVRTKVTPSNPRTPSQMFGRSILGSLSGSWSGLTDAQRRAWNSAVDDWMKTDIFGDSRKPTGKNLFTGLNKEIEQAGGTRILLPPEKQIIPELGALEPLIDLTEDSVKLGAWSIPAGFKLQVSATPAMSQGTSFVKDKLRVIYYNASGALVPKDIFTAYVNRFGTPVDGQNIYFGVKLVADTGQAGVPVNAKADFMA